MRIRAGSLLTGLLTVGMLIAVPASKSWGAPGSPGSLDQTFGRGGISVVSTGSVAAGVSETATLLSNGDILTLGGYGLARFLPNGKLDSTFGTNGFSAPPPTGATFGALTMRRDGKVIVVGSAQGSAGSEFAVAQYNSNGTLDVGFGSSGLATSLFPFPPQGSVTESAESVVLQPDGKMVVGGFVQRSGYRSSPAEAALLRLDPNGAPDRTFGAGSQVLTSSPGINNVTAIGLDTSGDIFVLPAHAEFSPTGQLDSTTRPSAITAASQGHNDVFLANGQYVHTASVGVVKHDVDVQAQRFNADGSVASTSATFDYSGAAGVDQGLDSAGGLAIQPNGQAVLGGAQFLGTDLFGLARVSANGVLDATFGTGGVQTTNIPTGFGFSEVLVQPDGKIIGVGSGQASGFGASEIILARYFG